MSEETCDHDLSAASRKVIHDVSVHGWHVMKVTGTTTDSDWAFSIGLFHTFQHPEILMFGLSLQAMHEVINDIGAKIRAGQRVEPEVEVEDLLEGYRCLFKPVDPVWYGAVLGYATWYYKGQEFPTLQCFWPDRQHRFPWDPDFDPELMPLQPLLFHSDVGRARAPGLTAES